MTTSPKEKPSYPIRVASFSEELKKEMAEQGGVCEIKLPTLVPGQIKVGSGIEPTQRLCCHALNVEYRPDGAPNEVCRCNGTIKTIVGKGSGDQTEILVCGKCRTAYAVRQSYTENGEVVIRPAIYELSRKLLKTGSYILDPNRRSWLDPYK